MISPVVLWPALAWLTIIPLAVANGALRQFVLAPRFGIRTAQPISGVLLMVAIAAVAWLLVGRLGSRHMQVWIAIGAAWFVATVAFEFGMGATSGKSWAEMLASYRFTDNNIWPIVLVWVAWAPAVLALVRRPTIP